MNSTPLPTYQQLLDENARLRQEVAQLRNMLGMTNQPASYPNSSPDLSNSESEYSQYNSVIGQSNGNPYNYNQQSNIQEINTQTRVGEPEQNYQASVSSSISSSQTMGDETINLNNNPSSSKGNSLSHEQEKERRLRIFESLFKGREDVFARRWVSWKGRNGYSPLCVYNKSCQEYGSKCKDCPNMKPFALNREYIYDHLKNTAKENDVIGIYPVKKDNTVYFLCADFDDKSCKFGYKEDVLTYANVAREWGMDCAIERSRSGNGAHAWIFFEESIQAADARRLGKAILDEAMNRRGRISFKSYDRFFPNQDSVPKDGFGNLVALPLQGLARRDDNSVFVDDNFDKYADQWSFLESLRKLSPSDIKQILSEHSAKEFEKISLISTLSAESDKGSESNPWETFKIEKISKFDFLHPVNIVRSNGLYFRTSDLSPKVINQLKRLASFYNPKHFKAQRNKISVFNIPTIISAAYFVDDYLVLPRGREDMVKTLLEDKGVEYSIEDKTNRGHKIDISFKGELYTEQQQALEGLIKYDNGILHAPTASGKTVIAMGLIAKRKVNTLILMSNSKLIDQWITSLNDFLELKPGSTSNTFSQNDSVDLVSLDPTANSLNEGPPKANYEDIEDEKPTRKGRKKIKKDKHSSPFGLWNAQDKTLLGNVDIASVKSCLDIKTGVVKDFVRNYGMIIVDECHHAASKIYQQVLSYANAKYVYGLTATPERYDGHEQLAEMQCGPIRLTLSSEHQRKNQNFTRVLVPRFTSFRWLKEGQVNFMELLQDITNDKLRNQQIIDDAVEAIESGRKPIIITKLLEHVDLLCLKLKERMPDTLVLKIVGSNKSREKMEKEQILANLSPGQKFVLVATDTYIGEGFDLPILDTLFLLLPSLSKVN